jgi:hypothetical protein
MRQMLAPLSDGSLQSEACSWSQTERRFGCVVVVLVFSVPALVSNRTLSHKINNIRPNSSLFTKKKVTGV